MSVVTLGNNVTLSVVVALQLRQFSTQSSRNLQAYQPTLNHFSQFSTIPAKRTNQCSTIPANFQRPHSIQTLQPSSSILNHFSQRHQPIQPINWQPFFVGLNSSAVTLEVNVSVMVALQLRPRERVRLEAGLQIRRPCFPLFPLLVVAGLPPRRLHVVQHLVQGTRQECRNDVRKVKTK